MASFGWRVFIDWSVDPAALEEQIVLWTPDRAASTCMTLMLGNVAGVLVQVMWWAFYMSFFWRAFTVERERRSLAARTAEVAGRGWNHVHERE